MYFLSALLFLFSLASCACALFLPQRNYLIPAGAEGDVYIFYGVEGGLKVEKSLNTTTFHIPDSRFLITNSVSEPSYFNANYYYVKNDGSRSRLEVEYSSLHRTEENLRNTAPFIWFPRNGSSSWSEIPCEVKYEQFYVGTRLNMLARPQRSVTKIIFDSKISSNRTPIFFAEVGRKLKTRP